MKHCIAAVALASAVGLVARGARADVRLYTIAVGNDAPPSEGDAGGEALPTLRYADDDAAAFFTFVRKLSQRADLLTVLDARSQQRFPDLAGIAHAPSLAEVRRVVGELKPLMESDKRAAHDPVVIFFFSGHGSRPPDKPASLSFVDGPMTQDALYRDVLSALPARHIHLVIDACYAEAVVRPRDAQAETVALSSDQVEAATRQSTLARFPNVGALIASSTSARAFEWDAIERGVFTHELLSGLRGAADVNGDGLIEYSEIDAFLSAANRDVSDPRARLSVIAHPPRDDTRAPLVDLRNLRTEATLLGVPGRLGRLSVEDELGNRLLDLRAEPGFHVALRIPPGAAYVRTDLGEARVDARGGETIALASLPLAPSGITARGAIEGAMARGLFAESYGPAYYRAFVDGREELTPVPLAFPQEQQQPPDVAAPASSTHTAGWIVLGSAGALAVATGTFVGLTVQAKSDYDGTSIERQATDARARFTTFGTLSVVGAAARWPQRP